MFGLVRPCRHVMCRSLFDAWMAHLCGLCLTLRAEHGQAARMVTNYDGLLVSALVEAQNPERSPHRKAGPCALRGMRSADVVDARAEGARLAAAVSLLLAAGKVRDHIADGDRAYARRLVAAGAGRVAGRWESAGTRTGLAVGFDTDVLRETADRQARLESMGGLGLLELTEPTETAVAAAFAHTAVLAGTPHNAESLAEAGRFFGRLAHLVDAVEDLAEDQASGAFNPLVATGTDLATAHRYCQDALHGLRLALADLDLADRRLVKALLEREVARSVDRVFAAYPGTPGPQTPYGPPPQGPYGPVPQQPHPPAAHPQPVAMGPGAPGGGWSGGGGDGGGGFGGFGGFGGGHGRPKRPALPAPCLADTGVCLSCGIYQPRWSKYYGKSCSKRCWCTRHDDCCDCCDCCSCDC